MVKLFLKNSNLCDHNSPTSQTDRQTTCDRNTALCTKVHRAVKIHELRPKTLYTLTFRLPPESRSIFIRRMKTSFLHPVLGTVSSRCAKKTGTPVTELVAALLKVHGYQLKSRCRGASIPPLRPWSKIPPPAAGTSPPHPFPLPSLSPLTCPFPLPLIYR